MPTIVFGPHPTGINGPFGIHLGILNTEVDRADAGTVPASLTVKGTGPEGGSNSCAVRNSEIMTVNGVGKVNAVYLINDCRTVPAGNNVPAQFVFRVTIRAEGEVDIAGIPIPVNIQIDSFEVSVATNNSDQDRLQAAEVG